MNLFKRKKKNDVGEGGEPKPPEPPRFAVVNTTQEEEDAYDLVAQRDLKRPVGFLGSVAYLVKGALGAGILAAHCGFAASGAIAVLMTCLLGLLVKSAQIIFKRTAICKDLSYSDVGEAAFAIAASPKIRKLTKCFRYFIDFNICLDLFGACCCYQLMISGTIKQVVEGTQETSVAAMKEGYPKLQMYMLMIAVPMMCVCLIKHLDLLGKLSLVGNVLVVMCIFTTVYYSAKINPTMKGMTFFTSGKGLFIFIGQTVFSMSCSGIVVAIENQMKDPKKFPLALMIGMFCITVGIIILGIFGYSAYGAKSKSPVTFHFPLTWYPMTLKVLIAAMLVITHAVNFWVPFNLLFRYLKRCHKPERHNCMEYVYRAICCLGCTIIGLIFPSVNKLMGFLGAFCLSNMAFIFPATIWIVTVWERPGLGKYRYRLVVAVILIVIGLIMFSAGTYVSIGELAALFGADEKKIDYLDSPHYE
ncbi:transmembrane amino acid transporter protein domain-containing protein [Phthorimaea operculella]|nr:transmembrane amino acid transporter protein domain-containing protein [Phthorimaea operculella]